MEKAALDTASFLSFTRRVLRLQSFRWRIWHARFALGTALMLSMSNASACRLEVKNSMSTPSPVSQREALVIAQGAVHAFMPEGDLVVENEKTQERDFGWVFFYSSRRYLETHDPHDMILGAGPLVVLRQDGSTHFLASSVSPAVAIETFEEQWRKSVSR